MLMFGVRSEVIHVLPVLEELGSSFATSVQSDPLVHRNNGISWAIVTQESTACVAPRSVLRGLGLSMGPLDGVELCSGSGALAGASCFPHQA
jgi:hypothetical protein